MKFFKAVLSVALVALAAIHTPAAAQGAPAKSRLQTILERGTLRVGTTGDFNPMSVRDAATNSYRGFDIEAMEQLAKDMGVKVEWVPAEWATLVAGITSNRYDIFSGASLSIARAKTVAFSDAIHAPSWDNADLLATPWLQPNPAQVEQIRALYPNAQAIFRERYADTLEPEFMAVCEALNDAGELWFGREPRTRCIVHGDFRLDNMLFDIKGGAEEIAVLDWQTVAIGSGLTDIGYFLGTGIGDALRRAHEGELLDLYCAEMTARGVPLTRDAIWDDYVIGALHGVSTAVFSAAYVERTARGDENFLSMARGGCALALQHGSIAKLKG